MPVKIDLLFSAQYLEYDIYNLLKAFWPVADIRIGYEEAELTGTDEPDVSWTEAESEEASKRVCCRVVYTKELEEVREVSFSLRADAEAAVRLGLLHAQPADLCETVRIEPGSSTLQIKNRVKQMVYGTLAGLTGKALPWGDLTGIRPVGLVSGLLEQGMSGDEIVRYMKSEWFVSDAKCRLALETAEREKEILERIRPEEGWSLYIGIPFCPSICLYCSFGSHPLDRWLKRTDEYLEALKKELAAIAGMTEGRPLHTIYIGGGTPTSLTAAQLDGLLETTGRLFPAGSLHEFTVEAGRPDTITKEKLEVLRGHAVNRISVNPQTMNDGTLVRIGRKHTAEETRQAFALARECGFANINMDLIVGLPGEGEREVARTLEEIRKLAPDSLTVHSLAMKRATRLHLFKDEYEQDSFVNSERIMDMTKDCAEAMGMHPYYLYRQKNIAGNFENTGYAVPGKEGLYNILIMEQKQPILAAGSGASTKLFAPGGRIERIENVKDLTQYLARVDEMIEKKRAGVSEWLAGA